MSNSDNETRIPGPKTIIKVVGAVVFGLIALSFILGMYFTVDQGEKAVQTRFGSIVRVADPGFNFKMPWIDSITKISTRTQTLEWHNAGKEGDSRMEAYSHDQQPAQMAVKLIWHVKGDDKSVRELYAQFKDNHGVSQAIIEPRAATAVKTSFGQFTAVSVVQDRNRFNIIAAKAVQDLVDQGADGKPFPVVVDGVQIYDITFSAAYIHAVEERMKAEVEVAKVTQNLERERKEAEIKVVQAEASAKSTKLHGEAEAYAIRVRTEALKDSPRLVELTAVEKWDGKLPVQMVPGSSVPFLHLSAPTGK